MGSEEHILEHGHGGFEPQRQHQWTLEEVDDVVALSLASLTMYAESAEVVLRVWSDKPHPGCELSAFLRDRNQLTAVLMTYNAKIFKRVRINYSGSIHEPAMNLDMAESGQVLCKVILTGVTYCVED